MAVTCSARGGRDGHKRSGKEELLPGSPSFGWNAEQESIGTSLETAFNECAGDNASIGHQNALAAVEVSLQ